MNLTERLKNAVAYMEARNGNPIEIPTSAPLWQLLRDAKAKIERLQAIVQAQDNLIDWYENEHERSCYDDVDIPEDLRELEEAIKAAEGEGNDE